MRFAKWIGLIAAIVLIGSCFSTWVYISTKNIAVSGVNTTGTSFGKPGYFHLLLVFFFLVLSFIPRVWAKRSNLLITALNLAWAVRNYFIISSCHMGDCPEKKAAIFLLIPCGVLMLIAALFPDIKLQEGKKKTTDARII